MRSNEDIALAAGLKKLVENDDGRRASIAHAEDVGGTIDAPVVNREGALRADGPCDGAGEMIVPLAGGGAERLADAPGEAAAGAATAFDGTRLPH